MKKILCIILAISTLASMLVFGVVAANGAETGKVDASYTPEGTAITSAAEFAAMTADGKYYLANDITIDATWNGGAALSATYTDNTAFTGTFDGNGHTITTVSPLFATFAGTVKNLTVAGDIAAPVVGETTLYNAAVAIYAKGTVVIDNVASTATVLASKYSGGLIAYSGEKADLDVTIKNSTVASNTTATNCAGGIFGFANVGAKSTTTLVAKITIENCVNSGDVTITGSGSDTTYLAGIIGRFGGTSNNAGNADNAKLYVKNTVNNGKVESYNGYAAGVLAFLYGYAEIVGCTNNGLIDNDNSGKSHASGIFAGLSVTDANAKVNGFLIDKCVNNGDIKGAQKATGIAASYANTHRSGYSFVISNCENHGDIYGTAASGQTETLYACGIAGQCQGGTNTPNEIINCINTGDIIVDATNMASGKSALAAGVFAYVKSSTFGVRNCVSTGNIITTGTVTRKTTLFYNATTAALAEASNNYVVAVEGCENIITACSTDTLTNYVTAVNAEQVASGEMVYNLNEKAGATIYYQDLKTGKITLTAAEDGSNTVIKNADGTYSNPVVEGGDVTTTPDAEVTTTPDADVTTTPEAEVTTTVPTVDVTTTVPTVETTTVPTVDGTTTAPADDDTTAPADDTTTTGLDTTTAKPTETTAKPVDTDAPEKKGCGGFVLAAQLVAILGAAVTVVIVKKK